MNPGEIVFNGQLFAAIPIALLAGLVSGVWGVLMSKVGVLIQGYVTAI